MSHPPNIDEFGNLLLLRQALDILAASEPEQQALYPPERDAAQEMTRVYSEAWDLVRPVFRPSLPAAVGEALGKIEIALTEQPVLWSEIRPLAAIARSGLPGRSGPAGSAERLRAWDDQIVRARNRLLLRRQT